MRLLKPSLWIFVVALLASLCIHLPVYEVLGVLADAVLHAPSSKGASSVVELELPPLPPEASTEPEPPPPEPKPEQVVVKREPAAKEPDKPRPHARKPEPEQAKVEIVPELKPPAAPVPPPPQIQNQQSVTQKSDDPDVEAPENAQFVAEENRRVLEETVAQVRNMHEDAPEQQPTAGEQASKEADAPGNDTESESADLRNVTGNEERRARAEEAMQKPPAASQASSGTREAAALARAAHAQEAPRAQAERNPSAALPQPGGEEMVKIDDGTGTFMIRKAAPGAGPRDDSGAPSDGAHAAQRTTRPGRLPNGAPDLRVSFSQYEDTFGSDKLKTDREEYVAQRRSRSAGANRAEVWKQFRGAIENYLPTVRPGNQTALNTAASPFAAYLAAIHRQIHQEFADRFLAGLPMAGSPMSDPALVTTLEIVINGDGSLHTVGVARSSGFLPYDYGAFSSVMKSAPYPAPPRKILSGDGRVYVHWAFYRNPRQCGTFNAQPYILPNPGGTTPAPGPVDEPQRNGPRRGPGDPAYRPREGELGALPKRAAALHAEL